ncbi:MAG: MerR family transcriptional regulator [Lachnospiraceae bacterium]|nr:MerR family transcriptional regulator [Lachnospiraceae bacterium]
MMTVNEVSKLTGVSIRTLQYYDRIGLLKPAKYTEAGYRLYDKKAMETLQQILLFKELEFPLKEIKEILSRPDFDRNKALEQQITLLTMKKEHLENLICFAREIQVTGVKTMDFSVFDTKKMEEYARQAKEQWGKTAEFKEFEQKSQSRSKEEEQAVYRNFMQLFTDFGKLKDDRPESADVQSHVRKLQDYITEHFYQCSKDILFSLGQMYAAGGEFTANIDRAGGEGTAEFVACAIRVYCGK